jgi:hypothetical protein
VAWNAVFFFVFANYALEIRLLFLKVPAIMQSRLELELEGLALVQFEKFMEIEVQFSVSRWDYPQFSHFLDFKFFKKSVKKPSIFKSKIQV